MASVTGVVCPFGKTTTWHTEQIFGGYPQEVPFGAAYSGKSGRPGPRGEMGAHRVGGALGWNASLPSALTSFIKLTATWHYALELGSTTIRLRND